VDAAHRRDRRDVERGVTARDRHPLARRVGGAGCPFGRHAGLLQREPERPPVAHVLRRDLELHHLAALRHQLALCVEDVAARRGDRRLDALLMLRAGRPAALLQQLDARRAIQQRERERGEREVHDADAARAFHRRLASLA
jgi:hypothetical protein